MIIGNSFTENFVTFLAPSFREVKKRRCNIAVADNLNLSRWENEIYEYKPDIAQEKADRRLVNSRTGINMTEEEFNEVDKKIKEGISNKESIYHIVKSNEGMPSSPTIYRWIKEKKLTTTWMDLPYAKTYKKRKKNEKYAYSNNKIDRIYLMEVKF